MQIDNEENMNYIHGDNVKYMLAVELKLYDALRMFHKKTNNYYLHNTKIKNINIIEMTNYKNTGKSKFEATIVDENGLKIAMGAIESCGFTFNMLDKAFIPEIEKIVPDIYERITDRIINDIH